MCHHEPLSKMGFFPMRMLGPAICRVSPTNRKTIRNRVFHVNCLLPLFLFVRLKNTRHISILRRHYLGSGALFAFWDKTRHKTNVGRIGWATEKPPISERHLIRHSGGCALSIPLRPCGRPPGTQATPRRARRCEYTLLQLYLLLFYYRFNNGYRSFFFNNFAIAAI